MKQRNWTQQEDDQLTKAVEKCGAKNWKKIADIVGTRKDDQCRQRWINKLSVGLNSGAFTHKECAQLINSIFEVCSSHIEEIAEVNTNRSEPSLKKQMDIFKICLLDKYSEEDAKEFKEEKKTQATPGKLQRYFNSDGLKSSTISSSINNEGIRSNLSGIKRRRKRSHKKHSKAFKSDSDQASQEDIKKTVQKWTIEEDRLLIELQKTLGDNWESMSKFFTLSTLHHIEDRFLYLRRSQIEENKQLMHKDLPLSPTIKQETTSKIRGECLNLRNSQLKYELSSLSGQLDSSTCPPT